MARENCLKSCSEWIINCLCCRPNQSPAGNRPSTSADLPTSPPGNPSAPAHLNPPTLPNQSPTSVDRAGNPSAPAHLNPPTLIKKPEITSAHLPTPPGNSTAPADLDPSALIQKPETTSADAPGNPTASAAQHPPTREDIDEMLECITQSLEGLRARAPSSAISRLPAQWQEYKGKVTSLMESLPNAVTNEVASTSKTFLLPPLKKLLEGVGGLHWMAFGCSLVAWSMDMMDIASQNLEASVKLLSRIIDLFKRTRNIWEATSDKHLKVLQDTVVKAFECAIMCSSMMEGKGVRKGLLRFLGAPTIKDSIANWDTDLNSLSQQISAFVGDSMYAERLQDQVTFGPSTDGIVGGEAVKQEAMEHLKKVSSEIAAVCLHGMGGIGKSTIGIAIFAEFQGMKSPQGKKLYGRCCRVELPWEIKGEGLLKNQKEILEILCRVPTSSVRALVDGRTLLEKELKNIKEPVFLYLDNVLDKSHLSELLPRAEFFPEGSRILVTTRHEFVGTAMQLEREIKDCKLIRVKKLDNGLAKEFLRKYLVQGKHELGNENGAEGDYMELERELLKLCDGLPLALKVVGAYIASGKKWPRAAMKRAIELMEKVESFDGGLEDRLYGPLMMSIKDLNPTNKKAFLDIVAFAEVWCREWEIAEHMVSETCLEALRQRALVEKIVEESEAIDVSYSVRRFSKRCTVVEVHDVLMAMGLKMVEEDKENIRITSQDGLDEITSPEEMKNVVGLMDVEVDAQRLLQMPRLRLLQDVWIRGECPAAKLKHLSVVRGMQSDTSRPFDMGACKALKVLQWEDVDCASNLEVLGVFPQLKMLSTKRWKMLENVDTIISLSSLTSLDLSGCESLQVLPEGVGSLTGLSSLDLSGCRSLQVLPEEVGSLTGLSILNLCGCGSLQVLPEGVGCLTGLSILDLCGCGSLQVLPEGVGSLTGLSILDLRGCESLQVLPEGVGSLTGLSSLDLDGCISLQVLPEGVVSLTGLSILDLGGCLSLQVLPEGVGSLTGLSVLDLRWCRSLQVLPEGVGSLTGLSILDLRGCGSLQVLPEGVGSLTGLSSLDLEGCKSLQVLPEGVGSLTGLSSLNLRGCVSLQVLPEGVGSLTGLSSLDLSWCRSLQVLPEGVRSLTGLRSLHMRGCEKLQVSTVGDESPRTLDS